LKPGTNQIRSPYGGPLTIEVIGRDTTAKPVTASISGGTPMPTFTLGKTTESDWTKEKQKLPNWITIQGEHVIGLDLKAPYTKASFKQMVAMVIRYDLLLKNHFLVSGYDLNPKDREDIHAVPQGWLWWVRDSSGKNPHAGNPVVTTSWHDDDINLTLDTWLLWRFGHEFGHGMQTPCYSGVFGGETTVNIYTALTLSYFCVEAKYATACKELGVDLTEKYTTETVPALAAGSSYEDMYSKSAWAPLAFWIQLIQTFGYVPIRKMHRRFREMIVDPADKVCKGDKFGKFDATYEILSEMAGTDLTKHFDTYKVPLSDDVRKRVGAKKYPQPLVNVSDVMVQAGNGLAWILQPNYALPPYSSFADAQ